MLLSSVPRRHQHVHNLHLTFALPSLTARKIIIAAACPVLELSSSTSSPSSCPRHHHQSTKPATEMVNLCILNLVIGKEDTSIPKLQLHRLSCLQTLHAAHPTCIHFVRILPNDVRQLQASDTSYNGTASSSPSHIYPEWDS